MNIFALEINDVNKNSFITKAEFDALKNNFQSQMNLYNSRIESKIDDAISSYLAGILLSKEVSLTSNINCFSYPVKIVNCINKMKNLDTPTSEQTEPFYSVGYKFYGGLHRGQSTSSSGAGAGLMSISLLEIPPKRQWEKWLNGSWNGDDFILNGMSDHLDYTMSGAIYYDGDHNITSFPETAGETGVIICDYKTNGNLDPGGKRSGTTRTYSGFTLYNDYDVFTNTGELLNFNMIGGIVTSTKRVTWNYGTTYNLDTWRYTGGDIWIYRCATEEKLKTYEYNPVHIDKYETIFNCGLKYDSSVAELNNTSYKKYLAPVTFGNNQIIYLTNLKKNRQAITQDDSTKSGWWNMYSLQTTNYYTASGAITTGLNIESEYSNSPTTGTNGRTKKQRSAVKTDDLYYYFTKADRTNVKHHMVDGIPILSVPSAYGEKIEKIVLKFNITSDASSNQKYAIFSTKPIKTQKYDDNVEDNNDYLKVTKINNVTSGLRKVELTEGDNIVELPAIRGNDVLYMKILWNDNTTAAEQSVTLNSKPTFVITQKDE